MAVKPLVSFLLVNWRGEDVTAQAVDSITELKTTHPYEIIIFDNESTAQSLEALKQLPATILKSTTNLGFGEATNRSASTAQGEYLALINNDSVVDAGWLDTALALMKSKEVGLVGGCELFWHQDSAQPPQLYSIPVVNPRNLLVQQCRDAVPSQPAPYVTASNVLIRTTAFKQVTGFDPDFFMYYEDMDLCAKIINSHYTIRYSAELKIRHRINYSSNRHPYSKYFLIFRNRYRIAAKYYPESLWKGFIWRNAITDLVRSPVLTAIGVVISLVKPKFWEKVVLHAARTAAAWETLGQFRRLTAMRRRHHRQFGDDENYYRLITSWEIQA
jgi:GT2 family glycosyltransferase